MSIEKRGAHLRIILYCGGKRYTETLEHLDMRAAKKREREKLRELEEELERTKKRRERGIATETRFSELLDQYRRQEMPTRSAGTQRAYEDSLKMLSEYFTTELRDPFIDRIGTREIRGFLSWRRTQRRAGPHQTPSAAPVSNRTLQKDRAVLSGVFKFAFKELELLDANPVARVEEPEADTRTPVLLDDTQYEALLTACAPKPQLWLYTLTLGETGGRCHSEVLHLKWSEVDFADGFLQFRSDDGHRTKSGKSRYVPMTPRLVAALKEHAARTRLMAYHGKASPFVFHHEVDRRGCKAGDRVKTFRKAFDTAAAAAGIPDTFHRHDLRHRRVTEWLGAGHSPVLVMETMGHSDLRTTMGYTHLAKEHLRVLVAPAPAVTASTEKTG